MTLFKPAAAMFCFAALAACEGGALQDLDRTVDRGIDSKELSELVAGVWVDPNGCDHWIIDDGIEGYLSQRLDAEGKPVCSGLTPNTANPPFQDGTFIPDPV